MIGRGAGRTPENQLILLSVATSARRESTREEAEDLRSRVDWRRLAELLGAHRLMPTLGPRIVPLSGGGEAPPSFTQALERSLTASRRQAALLSLVGERLQAGLARAGIRSAPLKGPQLGEAIYGDPTRRLSSDIDLLVAREQLNDAVAVVRELGYAAPRDHIDRRGLPLLHFALVHERGELPSVELHWRVHCYEEHFAELRLLAPEMESYSAWRPAAADELVALLLFYARDGFVNLRLAADLGAWWDTFGDGLEADALEGPIDAFPAFARVLPAAARMAEAIAGLPAGRLTRRAAKLDGRSRLAMRLAAARPPASQPQVHAEMGLIDGLLAPSGGFREFLRRQVILPRDVLVSHARASARARRRSVLGHGVRVLGRYGLAMIRAFRLPADVH